MAEDRVIIETVFQSQFLNGYENKYYKAPYEKVQMRAMPEAGQQPDYKEIEYCPSRAAAAASQRDIHVFSESRP